MTAIIVLLSLFGLLLGAVPAMLVIAVITSANEDLSPLQNKYLGGEVSDVRETEEVVDFEPDYVKFNWCTLHHEYHACSFDQERVNDGALLIGEIALADDVELISAKQAQLDALNLTKEEGIEAQALFDCWVLDDKFSY